MKRWNTVDIHSGLLCVFLDEGYTSHGNAALIWRKAGTRHRKRAAFAALSHVSKVMRPYISSPSMRAERIATAISAPSRETTPTGPA